MITMTDMSEWPSVADVAYQMRLSQSRAFQLVYSGELDAVHTRVGWLVNPASVADLIAKREAKRAAKEQASQA